MPMVKPLATHSIPSDPQRLCSACHTGRFFVTYGDGLLSLICVNCRQPVVFALDTGASHVVTMNTIKKGG